MLKHVAILFLTIVAACQPQASDPPPTAPTAAPAGAPAPGTELALGDHALSGILYRADDAGYPMFWLEVGPAGGKVGDAANQSLLFNNEEGAVEGDLGALVGKPVQVNFTLSEEAAMTDVRRDGKSIVGDPAPASPADRTITGVLTGAVPDSGDLPSVLTVTAPDGARVDFKMFVNGATPLITGAEGKTVTLVYSMERVQTATLVRPAPAH